MARLKILLVGSPTELGEQLQKRYDVVVEADSARAAERLRREWLHLGIIYLRETNGQVDPDALALALEDDGNLPKLIVFSEPLSQESQTVRQALTNLERPAPAVAVVSEKEGLDTILHAVDMAVKRYVRINRDLQIQPDARILFRDLANHLMPESDPAQWVPELQDLFRNLFYDCTSVRLELPPRLQRSRGKIATVWAQPRSQAIPDEHPLLVKCGRREAVERIRQHYETYLFRLTHLRLAGYAQTRHFASVAYPTPGDRPDVYPFPTFYRFKVGTGAEDDIGLAIDHLFDQAGKPWYRQIGAPSAPRDKDLRSCYLARFGMRDRRGVMDPLQEIIKRAGDYGMRVKLKGEDIGVAFSARGKLDFYPNPVLHLYGDARQVEVFETRPSQLRISHGNLRGSSFCVDDRGIVWLDGYESLEWGPDAADVAGMEAILKFRCLNWDNPRDLYQFERLILSPIDFDDLPNETAFPLETRKALKWILYLRKRWAKTLSMGDMLEYYANLFFFTMREFAAEETTYVQKLHALLSAAMICYRLQNWGPDPRWPGSKLVSGW